ncbi:hypothetical protein LPW36_05560 [Jinshanibacter sp. LJY008]|uniref:Uncharacterized protein n=1 Tax=Limnobaculum eriocheiris TaxID=2897391 RepID=A0A9X1MV27_9GAMM|nr:hypothetical protein [Limnobaculum eriocheiris]MCD1125484.1 hypothetical protein [Limnobaculum eriocheiris]
MTLAKRLVCTTKKLGFNREETIYTNALLLCSADASSINAALKKKGFNNIKELIKCSMEFFAEVTIPLSQPELIIAYSNGNTSPSAAKIFLDTFGLEETFYQQDSSRYKTTYSFIAKIGDLHVPVVGIRHMSRFKPDINNIRSAWDVQKTKLQQLNL